MAKSKPPKPTNPPSRELHFYPGEHVLTWVVDGKVLLTAKAWGGEVPTPGQTYVVMKPRPTTPGRFVVHSYAPYRTRTWAMSKIVWGTALMLDAAGTAVLFESGSAGRWEKVEDRIPMATPAFIRQQYRALYGTSGVHDPDGDGIPDQWVFNDFGPWAVRYFVDKNHNRKLDKDEALSGEMFHTTPDDEANAARGLPVNLAPSHGCIHLDPSERELLHKAGAFDKGNTVVVHSYKTKVPAAPP